MRFISTIPLAVLSLGHFVVAAPIVKARQAVVEDVLSHILDNILNDNNINLLSAGNAGDVDVSDHEENVYWDDDNWDEDNWDKRAKNGPASALSANGRHVASVKARQLAVGDVLSHIIDDILNGNNINLLSAGNAGDTDVSHHEENTHLDNHDWDNDDWDKRTKNGPAAALSAGGRHVASVKARQLAVGDVLSHILDDILNGNNINALSAGNAGDVDVSDHEDNTHWDNWDRRSHASSVKARQAVVDDVLSHIISDLVNDNNINLLSAGNAGNVDVSEHEENTHLDNDDWDKRAKNGPAAALSADGRHVASVKARQLVVDDVLSHIIDDILNGNNINALSAGNAGDTDVSDHEDNTHWDRRTENTTA